MKTYTIENVNQQNEKWYLEFIQSFTVISSIRGVIKRGHKTGKTNLYQHTPESSSYDPLALNTWVGYSEAPAESTVIRHTILTFALMFTLATRVPGASRRRE